MQNIPPELIITVKSYINITSFKMKGSPDLGQADIHFHLGFFVEIILYLKMAVASYMTAQ